jgi:hypothetical protein
MIKVFKILGPKEHLIKDILKMFDNPVPPKLGQRNKKGFYP